MGRKPRVIIHSSTAPFEEHYIDVVGLREGFFNAYPGTDDQLFVMVAKSIVAKDKPFWEVQWDTLNSIYDPATRDAWVLDPDSLGEPTGYGDNENV